jgi:hypothetical protein
MRSVKFFACVAMLLATAPAQASVTGLTIIPANPTSADSVSIRIDGTICTSWINYGPHVTRAGNSFTITVVTSSTIAPFPCTQFAPYSFTSSIGSLPIGTYTVAATEDNVHGGAVGPTVNASFSVSAPVSAPVGTPAVSRLTLLILGAALSLVVFRATALSRSRL